ncbi:hypothetical protein [Botrimarina hoheduenensis]|uniref:DUF2007 domain-containing protein n=1 Tax=Botrimarina hoheduenensis TaxID=2528000 RepID=A0A5C5VZL3_9BACT|nr:hypothetical protein [Botrimarina hoheduenensis]TWT43239.1 hypothetical protein Pla111_21890 [Botrimarina hoheduenensis]
MEIDDPIVAFIGESNLEAIQVAQMLIDQGLSAHAEADESVVGLWAFGKLPQIHQPRVWIGKKDQEEARDILATYEQKKRERRKNAMAAGDATVEALCEECGKSSTYPSKFSGTVQECRHCRANLDVGEFDWPYDDPEAIESADEE